MFGNKYKELFVDLLTEIKERTGLKMPSDSDQFKYIVVDLVELGNLTDETMNQYDSFYAHTTFEVQNFLKNGLLAHLNYEILTGEKLINPNDLKSLMELGPQQFLEGRLIRQIDDFESKYSNAVHTDIDLIKNKVFGEGHEGRKILEKTISSLDDVVKLKEKIDTFKNTGVSNETKRDYEKRVNYIVSYQINDINKIMASYNLNDNPEENEVKDFIEDMKSFSQYINKISTMGLDYEKSLVILNDNVLKYINIGLSKERTKLQAINDNDVMPQTEKEKFALIHYSSALKKIKAIEDQLPGIKVNALKQQSEFFQMYSQANYSIPN